MALRLVSEHGSDYFPKSVQQLGQRVVWQPRLISFLATFMRFTQPTDPPERRERVCSEVLRIYPAVPPYEAHAVAQGLQEVDNEPDEKARSKVVEYVVYKVGPFARFKVLASDYACSVRDGDKRLVDPDPNRAITVDAAFLGEGTIEIHECKFNPRNFLYEQGNPPALQSKARRKLEYLDQLRKVLMSQYGITADIWVTGFSMDVDRLGAVLKRHGFGAMRAAGPKDLEEAAARRARTQASS